MIHDMFTNQADALKTGAEKETPKKFEFMLEHQDKFEFIISFLTKAEIMRELVSSHSLEQERVEKFWLEFVQALNPQYVKEFTFDERIVEIVGKVRMRLRTMVNFFHLFIAMREQAYFVSGDKQIVDKIQEAKVYDKILTYIDLQKLAANPHHHSYGES